MTGPARISHEIASGITMDIIEQKQAKPYRTIAKFKFFEKAQSFS